MVDTARQEPSPAEHSVALQAIGRMQRRVRFLRACRGAIELSLFGVAYAIVVLLLAKTGRVSEGVGRRLLASAGLFPLLGAAVGALLPVPALKAAQLLDHAYDLKDRLANALEFRALPPAERTPMMQAALDDAAERATRTPLETSRALRWHWPHETRFVLGLLVLFAGVSVVEFRTRVVEVHPAPPVVIHDPLLLTDDDIQAFREYSREMERHAASDESREAVHRFNQFIDQVADQRLDRQDAFRRLQSLQDDLEHGRDTDREALRDALRELGNHMDRDNASMRPLADALRQPDPQRAAEAMHQLAEQIRQNQLNAPQRQALQQALQHASQQRNEDPQQESLRRAREEVERLLRQQREHSLSQGEQRNLMQRQRELEHLQRDQQHREQQRRQLERLNRAMSQAAQDLARDLAQAAQDLEQGAEDLNHMQEQQLTDQQMEEMRQQLEDLRQRMRQQNGQGGQQQRSRLQRFAGQARGGVLPGGQQPGGRLGQLRLMRGGGGGGIPMPMPGGQGQGQQGSGGQQGNQPGGVEAGTEHDDHIRGAATSLQARMRTVNVAGQNRGNGPSRSQLIRTAAQEGFTSEGYRDLHAQYWQHANEVVHAGEVPPGYRSYVRHYFELIRPRDGE